MPLSLSVRIAEGFLSKEHPILPLEAICQIAVEHGYSAICMRASQVGIQSSPSQVSAARALLDQYRLNVSMLTGDFDIVYNNERGPNCLRQIQPYLRLARDLGAPLVRVALRSPADIEAAQVAADQAAQYGLTLGHQCHTLSLFETVDSIVATLQQIQRPNFGLIYEPANLELCQQNYGDSTLVRLAPWIKNVYLQNQRLSPHGQVSLDTWCRGPVRFDIIPVDEPNGIDFSTVFQGLDRIGYRGFVTLHQSAPEGTSPGTSAGRAAAFLRSLPGAAGLCSSAAG